MGKVGKKMNVAEKIATIKAADVLNKKQGLAIGKAAARESKADLIAAKAKLAAARKLPSIAGNIAKGVAGYAAAKYSAQAEAAKANAQAAAQANAQWNTIINQNPTPVEGTGSSSTGSSGNNSTGDAPSLIGN